MPPKKKDKAESDQDSAFEAEDTAIEHSSSEEDDEEEFDEEAESKKRAKPDDDFEEEAPKKKTKTAKKESPGKKKSKETEKKPKKTTKKEDKEPKSSKKATGKGDKKASIRDVGAIEEMLLEYVSKHNRPHAVQSLLTAFKNSFGKTGCEKALGNLCKRGNVTLKQSGKAKVYYVAQNGLESVSKEELVSMDEQIKGLQGNLKEIQEQLKEVSKKRDEAVNSLTTEQLRNKISNQKSEIEKKTSKLSSLQSTPLISDEDAKKLDVKLEKYQKEWRSRKSAARRLMDQIGDQDGKKNAEIIEEFGLDNDTVDIATVGKL